MWSCIYAHGGWIAEILIAGVFARSERSPGFFEGSGFTRWGHLPQVAELDGVERDLVYLGLRLAG